MSDWAGGFAGVGFTRPEFRDWLRTQKKPPYHRIVNHMTDAPYARVTSTSCEQRAKNLGHYYKVKLGWSGGPDFFALGDGKIYLGSPLGHSIGCVGWNGNSFHLESEGRYDGKTHDHKSGQGLENWRVMAWAQAELLDWMGWELTPDIIKLHKEGNTSHKGCPGVVPKDWIIGLIKKAQGASTPEPTPVDMAVFGAGPRAQLYDVKQIQERLKLHGFDPGPLDGLMGPKTDRAIRAYQTSLTVAPTGVIGPWTMSRLREVPKPAPGASMAAIYEEQKGNNPEWAMHILGEAGYTAVQAAGIVGNLQRESYPSLKPEVSGDKIDGRYTAFGIGQWRNERFAALSGFAAKRGKNWSDFETQVLFVDHELTTTEKLAAKWLNQATLVGEATAAMTFYERPAGYIAKHAKAAKTWNEVMGVAVKCDGWLQRLAFATALLK